MKNQVETGNEFTIKGEIIDGRVSLSVINGSIEENQDSLKPMTLRDVASLLRVCEGTIRNYIKLEDDPIPHMRASKRGKFQFDRNEVLEWYKNNK